MTEDLRGTDLLAVHRPATGLRRLPAVRALYSGNARVVVRRGLLATKSTNWVVVVSGFFEPVFFLLAMGVGLGSYIGDVDPGTGTTVPYAGLPYAVNVIDGQLWITRQTKYQFDQVSAAGAVQRTIQLTTTNLAIGHWIASFR